MKASASCLLVLLCIAPGAAQGPQEVAVTFRVIAPEVPDSGAVFIAGNQEELGNWNPGAVPLQRRPDGSWERTFRFVAGSHLEYKLTRGSWNTEAVGAEGRIPANSILEVTADTVVVIHVTNWRDRRGSSLPQITGTYRVHRQMAAAGIKPRDVVVWLPPGYDDEPTTSYPVLYLHDGQNVFDPSTSFLGIDWQVDEAADSLIRNGKMEPVIIVGIYNTDDRVKEYSDTPLGRRYMRFVAEDLKAFIDQTYHTLPGRLHTATMGSSMGGLISFLLVWNYPEVFSMAGCLSPAFIWRQGNAVQLVERTPSPPAGVRIYIDNGGIGLEDSLQPGCDAMLQALQREGFVLGKDLFWFRDENAEHNEAAWARRVWRPLTLFFGRGK